MSSKPKKHKKSHKKDRKKSPSPKKTECQSSSSEDETANISNERIIPPRLMQMSLQDLENLLATIRNKKAEMKSKETPEEKRTRRLAKKKAKEKLKKEKIGWDKEYLGYTNEDNPFGDNQLSQCFMWTKKLDKTGLSNLPSDDIQFLQRKRMEQNKLELEAVRRRRIEHERCKEEREKEQEILQREKEAEYYRSWGQQEDTFHLEQAKLRSKIRIADGRAKPIDLLSKYISDQEDIRPDIESDDNMTVDLLEPTQFLIGLSIDDLEDLIEDIKIVYISLEKGSNADFWLDITTVVKDEMRKLNQKNNKSSGDSSTTDSISPQVMESISKTLEGKTYAQLSALEKQIQPKLSGGKGVDIGYWECLNSFVKAQMARTRLLERHEECLRRKLEILRQAQGIISQPIFPSGSDNKPEIDKDGFVKPSASFRQQLDQALSSKKSDENKEEIKVEEETSEAEEREPEPILPDPYDSQKYSPKTVDPSELELDCIVYTLEDDQAKMKFQRQEVKETGQFKDASEDELMKIAKSGMEDGEDAQFSVPHPLEDQSFLWSDKYRPRKPRFFNRVHTGYVWNKYNQTHYDVDNPPPKIVQGYKFNIFYPDLIDKSKPPTYTLKPIAEDNFEFAILRFTAGPPYEDIAFRIVNREWEYSYRHGYRCQFQNNIFQLWFHFKHYKYRR